MEALANSGFKYQVIKVDIAKWDSPVANQFQIKSVPSFRLYDKSRKLTSSGREAYDQIYKLIDGQ